MAKRVFLTAGLFVLLSRAVLLGGPVYGTSALGELIGDRKESNSELTLAGDWLTDSLDQVVSWDIVNNGDGTFTYSYTFTDFSSPAISHFTLDLSDNPESDPDIVTDVSWKANGISQPLGDVEIKDGDIDGVSGGVKFDFGGIDGTLVYTFTSNRLPVYGDFFLKAGSGTSGQNIGFGNTTSAVINDYIPRPNGTVPEPSAFLFLGMAALGGIARQRFAKRRQR